MCYIVLQCVAVCCSVLQHGGVCCSVLHFVAVLSILKCVVVCCKMLQCVAVFCSAGIRYILLQCGISSAQNHSNELSHTVTH